MKYSKLSRKCEKKQLVVFEIFKDNEIEENDLKELVEAVYYNKAYVFCDYTRNGNIIIYTNIYEMNKFIKNNRQYKKYFDKLISEPLIKCPHCGTYSNVFFRDYRENANVISKYISCRYCWDLSDKEYFNLKTK